MRFKRGVMDKQLERLNFEEWLTSVFDHPVPSDASEKAWYWEIGRDWWDEDAPDTVYFLTQAFEHAAQVFQLYNGAQLNQGLRFLVDSSSSSHMFALLGESVPWADQKRCIYSFHQLFEQCFARRSSPHLGYRSQPVQIA